MEPVSWRFHHGVHGDPLTDTHGADSHIREGTHFTRGNPTMLRIRDIMTRDVVTIDPQVSIRDAMDLLAQRHIGGAPVVNGSRVEGVVSLTDLVSFAAALPDPTLDRATETDWDENEEEVEQEDEPSAEFFAELWDDDGAEVVERFGDAQPKEWNVLKQHTVAEAMTRTVRALPPNTEVHHAATVMTDEGIHRLLVMEEGELLGIVTLTDIAKAAADHRLTTRTYVFGKEAAFDDRVV